MNFITKYLFFFLFIFFGVGIVFAQKLEFRENKGQWNDKVYFRANLPNGKLFLEKNSFTYLFHEGIHSHHPDEEQHDPEEVINLHAFKVNFNGANTQKLTSRNQSVDYANYFLGKNPEKWASKVYAYSEVVYEELYSGIDLKLYSHYGNLKYDLIVEPHALTSEIELEYESVDKLEIQNGNLVITTSVNTITEWKPVAFQHINGEKIEVPCAFELNENKVKFSFPEGYNTNYELIIDPEFTFGTYSNSTSDNFGFTATYDFNDNAYGGGVVFSALGTYPTTTGAYQTTHGGNTADMAISKFSSDGTMLLFSTYVGGLDNEAPHSLVVNENNELYVLGTTGSSNYPTTVTAFDNSFNGGVNVPTSSGFDYTSGVDIVVSKFSEDGTSLLASTFIGGTDNDGLNTTADLNDIYGDMFRGEIVVDENDNCFVVSTTMSIDFPTESPFQATNAGGGSDACVFKMNSTLSSMVWGSYFGGTGDDSGYGIQKDTNGNIFITGGTTSTNLSTTSGAYNSSMQGGVVDGYIAKILPSGSLERTTYVGTGSYDQSYFVQVDTSDFVYVLGTTEGTYPVSAGVYANPSSGQFIHKFNNDLTVSEFSTVIGTGSSIIDISPCAFLVADCGSIYLSGWGAPVGSFGYTILSTTGMPVTSDAFQSATDGRDFYLMVLDQDAVSLNYATFFGGTLSREHVDGGTSRFDKKGVVYQGVCAGCGSNDDFPTTSDAWSTVNGSTNCNLGVFKFDLSDLKARFTADNEMDILGDIYVCYPDTVELINTSLGGTEYFWDMGDGVGTSTDFEPNYIYADTGTFEVMLIVSNPTGCVLSDTAWRTVYVLPSNLVEVDSVPPLCSGDSVQLNASGGLFYAWSPTTGLSDSTIANPWASPSETTTYTVIGSDTCGWDTAFVTIEVYPNTLSMVPDTFMCIGGSVQLYSSGGIEYNWSPGEFLNDSTIANPVASPPTDTYYSLEMLSPDSCLFTNEIVVYVDTTVPLVEISNDTMICPGDSVPLFCTGGHVYVWSPPDYLSDINDSMPTSFPESEITYVCEVINGCGIRYDSVSIFIGFPDVGALPDTFVCIGDSIQLSAWGGGEYSWSPDYQISNTSISDPYVSPLVDTTYQIIVFTDSLGCPDTAYTNIQVQPLPNVYIGEDIILEWGNSIQLNFPSNQSGQYSWEPMTDISCADCESPIVKPLETTNFIAHFTDEYGCKYSDTLLIILTGSIYAPNAFSPDGDRLNDLFYAYGREIKDFKMEIRNRWGDLIFVSDDLDVGWDGTFKNRKSPIGRYVYKILYTELSGKTDELYGSFTLIR